MNRPNQAKRGGARHKPAGIAPKLLLDQVKNTASWAFAIEPRLPVIDVLERAPEIDQRWQRGEDAESYLALQLAAHFTTVATFVPTDVDQRIRQHAWATLSGRALASAVDRVEEVTRWDVRPVSERHIVVGDDVLAGHQGEWFSVMAGALGRALALGDATVVERTSGWIEAELAREARLVAHARRESPDQELLAIVTTVAHNLGDLSRVVDTWRPDLQEGDLGRRYRRLGHEDGERFDGHFVYAGDLNKRFMALENHRFLPLRIPRALRRERAFLLPFGPYFHGWGQRIATTPLMTDPERAEVLLALLRLHEQRLDEQGCLRAIAGLHRAFPGGIDRLARLLPAGSSVSTQRAGVRQALRVEEKDFLARFHADITR